jgi:hypothetical protein
MDPSDIEIKPLPLLRSNKDHYEQCVELHITVTEVQTETIVTLIVEQGSRRSQFNLGRLNEGKNYREVFLEESAAEVVSKWIFKYQYTEIVKEVLLKPVKKWEIYLVLHSHTDVGFTDSPSKVAQIHIDNTDQAIILCNETRSWPMGSQFKWTCEVSWQIENYIRERPQEKIEELMKLVREGRIEICGLYAGELTELLGHEEAVRSLYYSAKLRRAYNIPVDTVILGDIPGCTHGFVQVMAKSGIQNFIITDNNFNAPFLSRADLPRPFFWQGYDNTEVLAWYTDHPYWAYIEGQAYGFAESYQMVRQKIPDKLLQLEESGYPFKEFQLFYGFDNFRLDFRPAVILKEWNEKWTFPKIRLVTAREFLHHVRQNYATQIPQKKSDWNNWWGGIAAFTPHETALSRRLHTELPNLEILNSFVELEIGKNNQNNKHFEEAYHQLLLFDEHTMGGKAWFAEDKSIVKQSILEGYGFVHQAKKTADTVKYGISNLCFTKFQNGGHEKMIFVFNPANESMSGMVECVVSNIDKKIIAEDLSSGKKYPVKIESDEKIKFKVTGIPPLGYKTYRIIEGVGSVPEIKSSIFEQGSHIILENSKYKIHINKRNGYIVSLFDKLLSLEIIKPDSLNFNQPFYYLPKSDPIAVMGKYIPEIYNGTPVPGQTIKFPSDSKVRIDATKHALEGVSCIINHEINGKLWLKQEVTLGSETNLIKFENTIPRAVINDPELNLLLKNYFIPNGFLYFDFPFNLSNARVMIESQNGILEPGKEQFKGSSFDMYAMHSWCQLFDKDIGITFCSLDAPLLEIGEISVLQYREQLPSDKSRIIVRCLKCGEWGSENESPYSKYQDLIFRFAIHTQQLSENKRLNSIQSSIATAYSSGLLAQNPLIPFYFEGKVKKDFPLSESRFCHISPANIQIMTFKKAEDGDGWVMRLREILGKSTTVDISFPNLIFKKALRTMASEEPLDQIKITNSSIKISFNAFAIETLKLHFS